MSRKADLGVEFQLPSIQELQKAYADLPKTLAAVTLAAACKRALQPGIAALKKRSPKGPTGNLQRSVAIKSVKYTKTRTGVAVVGYKKAGSGKSTASAGGKVRKGSDRAFHQFWLEFGTDERRIRVPSSRGIFMASSFNTLGPFRIKSTSNHSRRANRLLKQSNRLLARASKQKFQDEASAAAGMRQKARGLRSDAGMARMQAARVQTTPAYPKAFFTARPFGTQLVLPPMHATEPVRNTWNEVKGKASTELRGELEEGLRKAQKQLEIRAAKANAKKQAALEAAAAKANPVTPF